LKSWRPDDWYEHQRFWTDADAKDRDAAITKALEDGLLNRLRVKKRSLSNRLRTRRSRLLSEPGVSKGRSSNKLRARKRWQVSRQKSRNRMLTTIYHWRSLTTRKSMTPSTVRESDTLLNQTAIPSISHLKR
jgi:hypothetical protein